MTAPLQQLLAASAMITALEKIASSGLLPIDQEIDLRLLIVRAGNTFLLDSIAERPSNVVQLRPDSEFIRALNAVSQEMGS